MRWLTTTAEELAPPAVVLALVPRRRLGMASRRWRRSTEVVVTARAAELLRWTLLVGGFSFGDDRQDPLLVTVVLSVERDWAVWAVIGLVGVRNVSAGGNVGSRRRRVPMTEPAP